MYYCNHTNRHVVLNVHTVPVASAVRISVQPSTTAAHTPPALLRAIMMLLLLLVFTQSTPTATIVLLQELLHPSYLNHAVVALH